MIQRALLRPEAGKPKHVHVLLDAEDFRTLLALQKKWRRTASEVLRELLRRSGHR